MLKKKSLPLPLECPQSLGPLSLQSRVQSRSIQETPRAKKQVNASLCPYEREINKANGCIQLSISQMFGMSLNSTWKKVIWFASNTSNTLTRKNMLCLPFKTKGKKRRKNNIQLLLIPSLFSGSCHSCIQQSHTIKWYFFEVSASDLVLKAEVLKTSRFYWATPLCAYSREIAFLQCVCPPSQ